MVSCGRWCAPEEQQPYQQSGHNLWITRMTERDASIFSFVKYFLLLVLTGGCLTYASGFGTSSYTVRPTSTSHAWLKEMVEPTGDPTYPNCVPGSKHRLCGLAGDGFHSRSALYNATGPDVEIDKGGTWAMSKLIRCELKCDGDACSDTRGMTQSGYNKELFRRVYCAWYRTSYTLLTG